MGFPRLETLNGKPCWTRKRVVLNLRTRSSWEGCRRSEEGVKESPGLVSGDQDRANECNLFFSRFDSHVSSPRPPTGAQTQPRWHATPLHPPTPPTPPQPHPQPLHNNQWCWGSTKGRKATGPGDIRTVQTEWKALPSTCCTGHGYTLLQFPLLSSSGWTHQILR